MDTKKYGGYTSVQPSHFMLVESEDKKGKKVRTIEAVPLYLNKEFEKEPEALLRYCEEFYGLKKSEDHPAMYQDQRQGSAGWISDAFERYDRKTTVSSRGGTALPGFKKKRLFEKSNEIFRRKRTEKG